MRILQLGPYPPPQGGVQHNLRAIHRFLQKNGVSSEVINITRHRKEEAGSVYYPKNWYQLLLLLIRLEYDIIHLHIGGRITPRLLALSLLCCLMPGSKTILTFHSGGYLDSPEGKSAGFLTARGWIFRRFDTVICVNEQMVALFQRFGLRHDRVKLIHPFVLPEDVSGGDLPEPIGSFMKSHSPIFVTVGLLESEYDLDLQVELIGHILDEYIDVGLVIIGSGSLEEALRAKIESLPFRDHIMLCGDLPHEITLKAIKNSNLFLRTTLYDGDSVAVRESIHLKTPVVATDNSMRPEGVCLIPVSDINALKHAVQEILFDLNEPKTVDISADEENIERVVKLYHDLLQRGSDG